MNIEVLLTEAEIAKDFAESLESLDLPDKFLQWLPFAAGLQEAIKLPLRLDAQQSRQLAGEVMKDFGDTVPVVSLGSGDGSDDRLLLQALQQSGKHVKYFPVEGSQTLLETASVAAEDDEVEVQGIKADISSPMHLILAADAAEAPRVFLMNSTTSGGFDPVEQIRNVAEILKSSDKLIAHADLMRDTSSEEDTKQLSAAAHILLAGVGIQDDDVQIRLDRKQHQQHDGIEITTKSFQAIRDIRLSFGGREFSIARGERVFMNFHYRFTPEAFRWLLGEHAKLHVASEVITPDGACIAAVCSC